MRNILTAIFSILSICSSGQISTVPHLTVFNIPSDPIEAAAKSKWKEIAYPSGNYTIVGYVAKNEFLPNHNILVTSNEDNDTIICGRYYTENGKSYIDGFLKKNRGDSLVVASGLFQISNTPEGLLSTRPKNSKDFVVNTIDIFSLKVFMNGNPILLKKKNTQEYQLYVTYSQITDDNSPLNYNVLICANIVQENKFYNVRDMLQGPLTGERTWNNGTSFKGKFLAQRISRDTTLLKPQEGTFTYENGPYSYKSLTKDHLGGYELTKGFRNGNWDKCSFMLPSDFVEHFGVWVNDSIYSANGQKIAVTLKNGDSYQGDYICKYDYIDDVNHQESITLTNGTYIYKTGETFKGNVNCKWIFNIPTDGVLSLKSENEEQVVDCTWFKKCLLTKSEQEEVSALESPTERYFLAEKYNRLNVAIKAYNAKEYRHAIDLFQAIKNEYAEKEYSRATYEMYKKAEAYIEKSKIMLKYGDKGAVVIRGVPKIGMTAEMIADFPAWHWVDKTRTTTSRGSAEVWQGYPDYTDRERYYNLNSSSDRLECPRYRICIDNGIVTSIEEF